MKTDERRLAYRTLLAEALLPETLGVIRQSTNKAWAMDNEQFRERIEAML